MNVNPSIMDSQSGQKQHDQKMESCYQRAQAHMQGLRTQNLVQNDNVQSHWIEQTDCFWYQRNYKLGTEPSAKLGSEFRLVDAQALSNNPAFDHIALAQALEKISKQDVDAEDLPIGDLSLSLSPSFSPLTVRFSAFDQSWLFDCNSQDCTAVPATVVYTTEDKEIRSPDGKQIAFTQDYNLWVRDVASGEARALTHDGEEFYCYAVRMGAAGDTYPGLTSNGHRTHDDY